MNWGLIKLFYVLALGCVHAQFDSSNPECKDLNDLQQKLKRKIETIPGVSAKLNCKPNNNCTGLICNGNINDKQFSATVIVEGCHEPVEMLVLMKHQQLKVTDEFKQQIMSKPVPVSILVNMMKKDNTVLVTVKLKVCLLPSLCPSYPLLTDQEIRVHCNNSGPTMAPRLLETKHTNAVSKAAQKSFKNPECKGMNKLKTQVEDSYTTLAAIYYGSNISCKPEKNCSDLNCAGVFNQDHFKATATIDYCTHPVKLGLNVSVPGKGRFNTQLADGDHYKIGLIQIKVNLKRVGNIIYLTASISTPLEKVLGPIYLARNTSFVVDPSHCDGYKEWTTKSPAENSKDYYVRIHEGNDNALSTGAIAGIVVTTIIFFALLIAIIAWIIRSKRQRVARYRDLAMNDTDPLFFNSDPALA